jgi:hypothetical protein
MPAGPTVRPDFIPGSDVFEPPVHIPIRHAYQHPPAITDKLGIPAGDAGVVLCPGDPGSPTLDVCEAAALLLDVDIDKALATETPRVAR